MTTPKTEACKHGSVMYGGIGNHGSVRCLNCGQTGYPGAAADAVAAFRAALIVAVEGAADLIIINGQPAESWLSLAEVLDLIRNTEAKL